MSYYKHVSSKVFTRVNYVEFSGGIPICPSGTAINIFLLGYRPTQVGEGEGEGEITCCILRIDCLLLALDAHMLSHHALGPGPGQGPYP